MPSFLKRKPEADAASEMPPWHPNLRNFARLPDTKVVRTAFFINGASVFIALALLLWFAYQEYQLHNLNRQIADWDQQISRDKRDSDKLIELYSKFQGEQARVNEVDAFLKSRPSVSQLLMRLGDTLPKDIALDAYEEQLGSVVLRGTVRGTPDEASGYASAYLDQLRSDKVLNLYFEEFSFTGSGVSRNPQNGRLSVQLLLRFKPALRGGAKK
jgi:hypothetical protein